MKKFLILIVCLISQWLIYSIPVNAICPICIASMGALVISTSYLGFNLGVIGSFIGAFAISFGIWFSEFIKKKYVKFQSIIIISASFLITIIPLLRYSNEYIYFTNIFRYKFRIYRMLSGSGLAFLVEQIPHTLNKMLFGGIIGGLTSLIAFALHQYIKRRRGSVLFPFQGLVLNLILVTVIGVVLYFKI